jgi:threonine/homoserine/homoserine lactone efflux protein
MGTSRSAAARSSTKDASVDQTSVALLGTALALAVTHTLLGPDHYLPFVAMARIGRWSTSKTVGVTLACGLGHVLSSILLGSVGIGLGVMVERLVGIEDRRGTLAGWLLLGFGLAYLVYGLIAAVRNRPHAHVHVHEDGTVHSHHHSHQAEHLHVHEPAPDAPAHPRASMTPWILFTIFVFGPCEPLIPMLMVPASQHHWLLVAGVSAVFGLATMGTMLAMVLLMQRGLRFLSFPALSRYSHVVGGGVLTACGLAVVLGL